MKAYTRVLGFSFVTALVAFGCSVSSDDSPNDYNGVNFGDGGGTEGGAGAGGSAGSAGTAGASGSAGAEAGPLQPISCSANAADNSCTACLKAKCCTTYQACSVNLDCMDFDNGGALASPSDLECLFRKAEANIGSGMSTDAAIDDAVQTCPEDPSRNILTGEASDLFTCLRATDDAGATACQFECFEDLGDAGSSDAGPG